MAKLKSTDILGQLKVSGDIKAQSKLQVPNLQNASLGKDGVVVYDTVSGQLVYRTNAQIKTDLGIGAGGTVPVSGGGTGLTSIENDRYLYSTAANTLSAKTPYQVWSNLATSTTSATTQSLPWSKGGTNNNTTSFASQSFIVSDGSKFIAQTRANTWNYVAASGVGTTILPAAKGGIGVSPLTIGNGNLIQSNGTAYVGVDPNTLGGGGGGDSTPLVMNGVYYSPLSNDNSIRNNDGWYIVLNENNDYFSYIVYVEEGLIDTNKLIEPKNGMVISSLENYLANGNYSTYAFQNNNWKILSSYFNNNYESLSFSVPMPPNTTTYASFFKTIMPSLIEFGNAQVTMTLRFMVGPQSYMFSFKKLLSLNGLPGGGVTIYNNHGWEQNDLSAPEGITPMYCPNITASLGTISSPAGWPYNTTKHYLQLIILNEDLGGNPTNVYVSGKIDFNIFEQA